MDTLPQYWDDVLKAAEMPNHDQTVGNGEKLVDVCRQFFIAGATSAAKLLEQRWQAGRPTDVSLAELKGEVVGMAGL